jgi:spore maturation protein CgeB
LTDLLSKRLLFITHTASGVPELEALGVGLGPNTDFETHYVAPLRNVFSEVLVYDLGRAYALRGSRAANEGLVRFVEETRPDFVLWHAMMYELSEEAVAAIRAIGACIVGWFSDDECRFDDYSRWWAPMLDWSLTTDDSVLWAYHAVGGHAVRMMWGSNQRVFRRLDLPFQHDVSFVGRNFGDREAWVSSLRAEGLEVDAFGRGWPEGSVSEDCLVELFDTSRINLCFVGADVPGGHRPVLKGRIFDVCMSGGFLLCEAVPGIDEFFVPGEEVVLFDGLDDAVEKARYFLADEEHRRAIASAGWWRAQQDHTQADRFRAAFEAMSDDREAPSPTLMRDAAHDGWSFEARRLRADWHFAWAKGLFEVGFPDSRVEEEVRLCLRDDPNHANGKRLAGRVSSRSPMRRAAARAADAARGAKATARGQAVKIHGMRALRREIRKASVALRASSMAGKLKTEMVAAPNTLVSDLFDGALAFTDSLRVPSAGPGRYLYSPAGTQPLAYASTYAVLLRHLLGDLDDLTNEERGEWAAYLNGFQCSDGLYRDPVLASAMAEQEDWWGWRHLTAHVVSALACLDSRPERRFTFLDEICRPGRAGSWIASQAWERQPDSASNSVMNRGVLLQYERDFCSRPEAGFALEEFYDYLDEAVDADTGLWGLSQNRTWEALSVAVQTSYHLWNLYFYDGRPIRHADRAVDSCLRLQNRLGGFSYRPDSSACEDIDAVDPLARLGAAGLRQGDVSAALRATIRWSWANRVPGGGMVFRRFDGFAYGHELMTTGRDEPHLFGTWFRALLVGYAVSFLGEPAAATARLRWVTCPGYQYWMPGRTKVDSGQ